MKDERDLLAENHARLAEARRLASDFEGARRSFNLAWQEAELGTGDPTTEAYITSLEANVMIDMGDFETAEATLNEALALYRRSGTQRQQAATLVKMGIAIGYVNARQGVRHIRQALALIDGGRSPRAMLCAQHHLAWFLAEAGENREALAVLDLARPLYGQFPDHHAQLRLHWLDGKLAGNLGLRDEAVRILRRVWEELRARELRRDLVMVSLDLTEVLVAKGDVEGAARLVGRVYPIISTWGLHGYALATWLTLREALELRRLSDLLEALDLRQPSDLLSRMRAYYRRYWHRPAAFASR